MFVGISNVLTLSTLTVTAPDMEINKLPTKVARCEFRLPDIKDMLLISCLFLNKMEMKPVDLKLT